MIFYTGIGSRKTPKNIISLFEVIGYYLGEKLYVLRSGHAQGADQAFEKGCDRGNFPKEIYLPWDNFEGSTSELVLEKGNAYEIAKAFHPNWDKLTDGAKKLQARNSYQVLGKDLKTPSSFIICWTQKGRMIGGTGQALRIAEHYNIPVLNIGGYRDLDYFKKDLRDVISRTEKEKLK